MSCGSKAFLHEIEAALAGGDARLYLFEEIDSTNTFAKALREDKRAIVVAAAQTAGRGRLGRQWDSGDGGKDLMLSFYYPCGGRDLLGVTLAAAVGTARALQSFGAGVRIKWPNDIMLNDKKLAGILCESVFMGSAPHAVVVGIGININRTCFEGEVGQIATSLCIETGEIWGVSQIAAVLRDHLDDMMERFFREGLGVLLPFYIEDSHTLGREVTIGGKTGRCTGFSQRGGLLLKRTDTNMEEEIFLGTLDF